MDDLVSPWQVIVSLLCFGIGEGVRLLSTTFEFITDLKTRVMSVLAASTVALLVLWDPVWVVLTELNQPSGYCWEVGCICIDLQDCNWEALSKALDSVLHEPSRTARMSVFAVHTPNMHTSTCFSTRVPY